MPTSTHLHNGKLAEVSPFGTGFIEDLSSDTCYGFHISMLFENNRLVDPTMLEGMQVRFSLSDSQAVDSVCLVHHPASTNGSAHGNTH
jgi:hypothetical protein